MKLKCLAVLIMMLLISNSFAMRDPTKPATYQDVSSEAPSNIINLTSILYSSNRKLVTINGKLLTVGEKFNSMIVLKIEPEAVVLKNTVTGDTTSVPLVQTKWLSPAKKALRQP